MRRFFRKLLAVLVFGILAVPSSAFCQVDTAWVRRYNGPGNGEDRVAAMAVDDSGNVYVTGSSVGTGGSNNFDYATIKYDRNGNELWIRRYIGLINGGGDFAEALALDKQGNVYVTGESGMVNGYGYVADIATIKYDPQGNELWVARYNGPANLEDGAAAITVDDRGFVYIAGSSTGIGTDYDIVTIKYDPNGNQLWAARYNSPQNLRDYGYLIAVDQSRNVYAGGYSIIAGCEQEWIIIKYDSTGVQAWARTYEIIPSCFWNVISGLKLDGAGNVYLTGVTSDSLTGPDYTTLKLDPLGNILWSVRYSGTGYSLDVAYALALDKKGNIYITGWSSGVGSDLDIVTIKYDSMGNQLWVRRYNGPGNGEDDGLDISVDSIGDAYVAGISLGSDSTYNYVILKYDSSGNFLWEKRYDKPVVNPANEKLAVDQTGNLYLVGTDIQNARDYVAIKYSPLPSLKGDLNLDGVLTMADVVLMLNFTFGAYPFPAAPTAADLNCDDAISPADVVVMLQIFFLSAPVPC